MNAVTHTQRSPFQLAWKAVSWLLRYAVLVLLYEALFVAGGQIVGPYLPNTATEPGPIPLMTAIWISSVAVTLVIVWMVCSSRWHGWKLMISMSVAYYFVVTFVTQLESWYFLYGYTIGPDLMWRLYAQGIPVAFIFVPLAVLIMGRFRSPAKETNSPEIVPMPLKEWLWKIGVIYIAYLALYYGAGYFIAWQNPDVRAFYGQPGEALPFFQQVFANDPWLTPYQFVRTLIWVAGAYLIIRGSRLPLWQTALIVGLVLSVPQNVGHLFPNPLLPINSVRISHMIETTSSTFVFGLIVTWLLYPKLVLKKS